jgi:hypothetical protein
MRKFVILMLGVAIIGVLAAPLVAHGEESPYTKQVCEEAQTATSGKLFDEALCASLRNGEARKRTEEEERRGREASEKREREMHEALEPKPLASLRLVIKNHHGHTYAEPGHTDVYLVTTLSPPTSPEGEENEPLFETLSGTGIRRVRWFTCQRPDELGEPLCKDPEGNGVEDLNFQEISWSCQERNDTFPLLATARALVGETLTATGVFREDLTRKWCKAAKKRELAAARRAAEEIEREMRREARRKSEEARHNKERYEKELDAWESNCRTVGGHVVHLKVGVRGATAPFCYGPSGNPINVPS